MIIGHSQFERIPVSFERQKRLLEDQIEEITLGIEEMEANNGERFSIKQLERTKRQLEARLEKLQANHRKDDVVTFEQLGVDRLYVDEAHSFKNLFLYTKMNNVAGLSTSEAQKSQDMFLKCRYIDEVTDGRGVVFATGTPVSNSMTELYTMQRYLNEFDKWVENTLIPENTMGKRQRANPEYARMNAEISKARKAGDHEYAHRLIVERRNIPSVDTQDEGYRWCRYVRYADDFIIGITGSKSDAEKIKGRIHTFLKEKLHLELSIEKTLITNASSEAAKFLGYEIKAQRANDYIDPKGRRGANGAIALFVPAKVIEERCRSFMKNGKVTHRNFLLQDDDFSIVQRYQQEYRGLVQYYILAQNLAWFSKLYWVMETSLLKTLAAKHRSSINKRKRIINTR